MIIKLARHAISLANVGLVDSRHIGDHLIPLASKGPSQARRAGRLIGADFIKSASIYVSPYFRTRLSYGNILVGAGLAEASAIESIGDMVTLAKLANEEGMHAVTRLTDGLRIDDAARRMGKKSELPNLKLLSQKSAELAGILREITHAAGLRYLEDVRLREVEHGLGDVEEQELLRLIHSYFFYRLADGGESPADSFDRISTFLESMMRQVRRKKKQNVLIVSHGLTIRCFVMRFLHLSIEEFNLMRNPRNCDIITIGPKDEIENAQFTNGKWAVAGLRLVTDGK